MKRIVTLAFTVALSATGVAVAVAGNMSSMPMGQKSTDHMKAMDNTPANAAQRHETHEAVASVKRVDPENGSVTLADGAIKSLKWPPMTMGFSVKDNALFDKLAVGSQVHVEFVQEGAEYVVIAVK